MLLDEFLLAIDGKPNHGIDVYQAMDMALPGIFAYRSVRNGGIPQAIPDFRNPQEREPYRNDNQGTGVNFKGEDRLPSLSIGDEVIPQEVYAAMRKKYEEAKKMK